MPGFISFHAQYLLGSALTRATRVGSAALVSGGMVEVHGLQALIPVVTREILKEPNWMISSDGYGRDRDYSAMAQVGGLVMLQPEVGGSRENFLFAGIEKVRFRKPVIAGDTLVMRMTLIKLQKRIGIAMMEGKAYVGGEVVCDGEFLMATGSE
ncbi:hypothetical protein POTOM_062202 [Populus tomentosa]|uniref:Beta-hydroxyacyl-ACP dehydratase n=1 Tax=Populus tomentosa TaxID=118781 RepID=A0A8X7XPL8_POPTO|nr:hypothetical protein POTOM_062202 [Populus tomentosa]